MDLFQKKVVLSFRKAKADITALQDEVRRLKETQDRIIVALNQLKAAQELRVELKA